MRHGLLLLLMVPVLLTGPVAGGVLVNAREATPAAGHGHSLGHGAPATPTGSPYAAGFDPTLPIRALTPEEILQIEQGEGAGFAKPAELNGLPGPRHVLDLAHELDLSADQRVAIQNIHEQMTIAAVEAGQRYLDAHRALEEDFRSGNLAESDLAGRVVNVYRLEGELAAVHLAAHLKTADLLTPEQIVAYNRLRGYA